MTHLDGDALLKMPLLLACWYVYHLSITFVSFIFSFFSEAEESLGEGDRRRKRRKREEGIYESSITSVGVYIAMGKLDFSPVFSRVSLSVSIKRDWRLNSMNSISFILRLG